MHPKYKTPINAVHAQFVVIVVSAVILTKWWGKENIWFVDGGMITFALGTIYILGSVSVLVYYLREKRDQLQLAHARACSRSRRRSRWSILFYKSLNPFPPAPFKWGPIVVGRVGGAG